MERRDTEDLGIHPENYCSNAREPLSGRGIRATNPRQSSERFAAKDAISDVFIEGEKLLLAINVVRDM